MTKDVLDENEKEVLGVPDIASLAVNQVDVKSVLDELSLLELKIETNHLAIREGLRKFRNTIINLPT